MKHCGCTNESWCSWSNDAEELKSRADARTGQKILLILVGDCWYGEHTVDGEPDPYIKCLFGSHRVALPFVHAASRATMMLFKAELVKQWPQHEVVLNFESESRVLPANTEQKMNS